MTDEQVAEVAVETVAADVKKEVENAAHPAIKSLYEEFKSGVGNFEAWVKAEIAKL